VVAVASANTADKTTPDNVATQDAKIGTVGAAKTAKPAVIIEAIIRKSVIIARCLWIIFPTPFFIVKTRTKKP
jgi:hypothetical protein